MTCRPGEREPSGSVCEVLGLLGVQHMVVEEGSRWRTPGLQVPSNFLLKEETPEEKVMKAKSHMLQGRRKVLCSNAFRFVERGVRKRMGMI